MQRLRFLSSSLRLATLFLIAFTTLTSGYIAQASTLIVTNTNDSGSGSLRQTIASAASGDTVNFDSSLTGQTITLTSGEIDIAKNLTITGPSGQSVTISGGGTSRIFCVAGAITVNLSNLTITNGSASATAACHSVPGGGGIFNNAATVSITNSTISNNGASSSCGGIWNAAGTLTLSNSTVSGNSAAYVGGICNNSGNLTITRSTISGNSATSPNSDVVAGGIGNDDNLGAASSITITNSTITGNTVTSASTGKGGGIYQSATGPFTRTITIINSTIANNTAFVGGGFYNDTTGTANLTNTIIAGNTGTSSDPDVNGAFTSGGNNLIGNTTGSTGWVASDLQNQSPNLGTLTGSPAYYPLLAGSPAIDAGTNSNCPSPDEAGTTRPQGSACDIGAYEVPVGSSPTLTVNTLTDASNGVCNTTTCTLRDAVALVTSGGTVNFSVTGTITLNSQINITHSLTISGPGVASLAIDGKNATRLISITSGNTVNLSGLTFQHGKVTGASAYGAAIYSNGASVTLNNMVFQNSSSDNNGAGIYATGGHLTISNSTFTGNLAGSAGAGGAIYTSGNPTSVAASVFNANGAGWGGGIYFDHDTDSISGSTFSNNTVSNFGGAVSTFFGTLTVNGSTFQSNTAGQGGALEGYSTLTVSNSTFYGNQGTGSITTSPAGAIYTDGSFTKYLINVTIANNSIATAQGAALLANGGNTVLENTIFSNNSGGSGNCLSFSTITDGGHNLQYPGTNCGAAIQVADPLLGPLQNNGGSTQTMALLPGSPAIDGGDNTICSQAPVNNLDQRGITRPQASKCDIGAYEYQFAAPTISKSFSPSTISAGSTSTLTFTVNNPNANTPLTQIGFSDTFPVTPGNMVIASTPGVSSNGCGSPIITANAGNGSITVSGATVTGSTCSVGVNITAPSAGTYNNTSSVVTASEVIGTTTAQATLNVVPFPIADLGVTNKVALGYTPGGALTYTITVTNHGPNTASNVVLNDTWMPSQFTVAGLSWTCTGGIGVTCPANGSDATGNIITGAFSLSSGNYATFSITGTVANAVTGDINNTATVSSSSNSEPSPDPHPNSATAISVTPSNGTVSDCTSYSVANGLQAALASGNTVTFNCGGTIIVPEIEITSNTTINGNGQSITLSGNNANRIFCVDNSSGTSLTVSGLILTGGNANGTCPLGQNGYGGAIYSYKGTLSISNSTIAGNSAHLGGGIAINQAPLTLSNSTVSNNSGGGGGINANGGNVTISGSTIANNSAPNNDSGGGIAFGSGTLALTNSTVTGNTTGGVGGGISMGSGTLNLTNSTLAANSAGTGGGVYITGGTLNPLNTIIAGNSATTSGPDVNGTVTSQGNNLIGNSSGSSGWVGSDLQNVSPHLGTLTGSPAYYPLLAGSPAINAGANSGCPATDEAGTARPQGGTCDIGAYEYVFSAPTISKAFSSPSVLIGSTVTLTFTVSNPNAPTALTGVSFSDTFPTTPGAMVIVSPNGLTSTGCGTPTITATAGTGSISMSGGTIAGTTCTVSVNVTAPSAGTYNNTSSVVTSNEINGTTTGSASLNVVLPSADLAVTNTVPSTYIPGQTLTYTLHVTNNGPQAANGVTLNDLWSPAQFTVAGLSWTCSAGTGATCPANGSDTTGNFTTGTFALPTGISDTFTIVGTVAAGTVTSITNSASVTSALVNDPNSTNNTATATSTNGTADLAVTKTGPASAYPGANLSYTVKVTNNGPASAQTVHLTDVVPANTTFVSESQSSGATFTCTKPAAGATGTVACTIATLANGGSATFNVVVNVNSSAASGTVVTNTANVTSTTTDLNTNNNAASANTTVILSADLSVTNTAPASIPSVGNISYTLNVHNAGPTQALGVSLTDSVPANTTFVSAAQSAGPAFACSKPPVAGTGTLNCTISSLASGATATFTVVMKVNTGTPPAAVITNSANVSSATADPNNANNAASVSTIVNPQADMAATNSGPATARPGSVVTYTVSVKNNGPDTAQGVTFTDTLPASGIGFVSETQTAGPAFSCTAPSPGGTGTVKCTIASLAPGATATFKIVVHILPNVAANTIVNASVSVTSSTGDPNSSNNNVSVATTIS